MSNSIEQLAVTTLVKLYHSAPKSRLDWDNLLCEISWCQENAEGRRTWSIGKVGAGTNCVKLAIRARSRPIFHRCRIFIRPTLAEWHQSTSIMTSENSANVAINSLMWRRNFRQPSFVHLRKCEVTNLVTRVDHAHFLPVRRTKWVWSSRVTKN